jgi:hypothetical protein
LFHSITVSFHRVDEDVGTIALHRAGGRDLRHAGARISLDLNQGLRADTTAPWKWTAPLATRATSPPFDCAAGIRSSW